MLALRGWRREDFDLVDRDFRTAIRHALFAERLAPVIDSLEEVVAMSPANLDATSKARLGRSQLDARRDLTSIRAVLMPDDVDG